MRRAHLIGLIVVGVVLFLVISALLTRALSVGDAEQSAITSLVRAEAAGDLDQVVSLITGCRTTALCRARAAQNVATFRRAGAIEIIQFSASSNFSLAGTLGVARVAWLAGSSLPRVQCVLVRHAGNVLSGFRVQLLEVSAQIESDSSCPSHF
ncbi:MAG: hypothetical protein ACLP50_04175 [Solirubrobacteraceae bacterium]